MNGQRLTNWDRFQKIAKQMGVVMRREREKDMHEAFGISLADKAFSSEEITPQQVIDAQEDLKRSTAPRIKFASLEEMELFRKNINWPEAICELHTGTTPGMAGVFSPAGDLVAILDLKKMEAAILNSAKMKRASL